MNTTVSEGAGYIEYFVKSLRAPRHVQTFLVVPYTHLERARGLLRDSGILLGAQNMHSAERGEFTGEISAEMLRDIGVNLVEIGHSERRRYFNEDDYTVNAKVCAALGHGLIPLVCVGEEASEREFGVTGEVIARQLKIALHNTDLGESPPFLIAYEPIWAIGHRGTPARPDQASEIHTLIREILDEKYGSSIATGVRILYGGSVNRENALDFLAQPNVDGLFVGRAGLDPREFLDLVGMVGQG
jgi:triosephosphate isomerase